MRTRLAVLVLLPLAACTPRQPCVDADCEPAPADESVRIDTFSAAPTELAPGASSVLTWQTANAATCAITPPGDVVPRSGTLTVTPADTTTYSLSCDGADGPAVADVTVRVLGGDAGPTDAGSGDAGQDDAGPLADGGAPDDGGLPDSGPVVDGGAADGGGPGIDAGTENDAGPTRPAPIHRWSFNGGSATASVEPDLVGGADGTVYGGTRDGNGRLNLDGDQDYVDLPNGLVSSLTAVTVEAWVVWRGNMFGNWQRIFDFGTNSVGELDGPNVNGLVYSAESSTHFHLSPRTSAGVMRLTVWPGTAGAETILPAADALPTDQLVHVAVTFDPVAGQARVYQDGAVVVVGTAAFPLSSLNDVNSFLGRSNYSNDPGFYGALDEVRIYDRALNDDEVAASFAAGPDGL